MTDANDMVTKYTEFVDGVPQEPTYEYDYKLDMTELAAALEPDDRQKLYELLHDFYNCRIFK